MADRILATANAFETTLTSEMGPEATSAVVATTSGGPASACLLVIEPLSTDRREYVVFDGTFDGTTFVTTSINNRYLDGSAAGSNITHPVGSVVMAVTAAQHLRDLHDRIDEARAHTDDPGADAHHTEDHASRHAPGGADEIALLGTHADRHAPGGDDEISALAAHADRHGSAGADPTVEFQTLVDSAEAASVIAEGTGVFSETITLPDGWTSMDVEVFGHVTYRRNGSDLFVRVRSDVESPNSTVVTSSRGAVQGGGSAAIPVPFPLPVHALLTNLTASQTFRVVALREQGPTGSAQYERRYAWCRKTRRS